MKVYIVTEGCYSDCRNIGVFTTREKADAAALATNDSDAHVEEWLLDNLYGAPSHYSVFEIIMDREGVTRSAKKKQYFGSWGLDERFYPLSGCNVAYGIDVSGCLDCEVLAKDIAHAVKIVNERRTRLIAENKWGVK